MSAETILTVLSKIPWGTVVESAPKLAGAAAKLWNRVRGRQADGLPDAGDAAAQPPTATELIENRLSAVEAQLVDIQGQMGDSAGLIKELAEQNALLVQKIEQTRANLVRLAVATGIAVVLAAGSLLLLALQAR